MNKLFTSNKTTIIGALGAVWFAIQPLIAKGDFDIARDYRSLVYAAIFAAFGFFSKDANVTGGTTVNPANDASVVKESSKVDK